LGRSQRLTLVDVRNVTRLAWEAAELSHDRFSQMQHLATGLRDLLDGVVSFAATLDQFVPCEVPVPKIMVPCLDPEPLITQYLQTAGRELPTLSDPFIEKGRSFKPMAGCIHWPWVRSQIEDWKPYAGTMDILNQAKSRDVAIAIFRHNDRRHITAVSVHRSGNRIQSFSTREHRLCTLLAEELHGLYRAGRLSQIESDLDRLPPSMRRIADGLLSGQSVKQIAHKQGLSIHTVRDYLREIYERTAVTGLHDLLRRYSSESVSRLEGPTHG